MVSMNFSNHSVLVTGGSSGIGNGIAKAFRDVGAHVHITGTRELNTYKTDLESMTFHQLDLADVNNIRALGRVVTTLDVLVNNAGVVEYHRQEYEPETFRRVLDINLTGPMHCATTFHKHLKARGGCVINVASLAAFYATAGNPGYSASKGGIVSLTRTLAAAWAKDSVRVNGIAPGFVKTNMTAISSENEKINNAIIRGTPLGRWGTPEDMAGPCLFLASELSNFITGQTLIVDGGYGLAV